MNDEYNVEVAQPLPEVEAPGVQPELDTVVHTVPFDAEAEEVAVD